MMLMAVTVCDDDGDDCGVDDGDGDDDDDTSRHKCNANRNPWQHLGIPTSPVQHDLQKGRQEPDIFCLFL